MAIDPPTPWSSVVDSFSGSLRFLADAQGIPPNELPEIPFGRPVVLAVGPEGGFTAAERKHAIQAGWSLIRLSVNTLRIETAALAGASILFSKAKEPDE